MVFIAGEEVASREVDTPNTFDVIVVPVDPRNVVPEGRQTIEVLLEDENGASAELSAGGRILFDRTAPEITIGNQLRDGICYNPNQIPDPILSLTLIRTRRLPRGRLRGLWSHIGHSNGQLR